MKQLSWQNGHPRHHVMTSFLIAPNLDGDKLHNPLNSSKKTQ